jgi:hypothetical protein
MNPLRERCIATLIIHGFTAPCEYPGIWRGVLRSRHNLMFVRNEDEDNGKYTVKYVASFGLHYKGDLFTGSLLRTTFDGFPLRLLWHMAHAAERENSNDEP